MALSPRAKLNPAWANLPSRKCDNCGTSYKQTRPLRSIDKYGFCKPDCKKSFHRNGGAYRKLKGEMEKLITKRLDGIEKQIRSIVLEELTKYARYAKVVEDFSPTLRLPAQSDPARQSNR